MLESWYMSRKFCICDEEVRSRLPLLARLHPPAATGTRLFSPQ